MIYLRFFLVFGKSIQHAFICTWILIDLNLVHFVSLFMTLNVTRLPGGELFHRLIQESVGLCEVQSRRLIKQILEAVKHLHQYNLVHLDIKVIHHDNF